MKAKQLTIKARDLDTRWRPQASNRVECRGEKLGKVFWRGRQWAATKYGVECRDGCYAIERARLWEDDETFSWVMHMAEKSWVDLEDFAEALRVARILEMCRTGNRGPAGLTRPPTDADLRWAERVSAAKARW